MADLLPTTTGVKKQWDIRDYVKLTSGLVLGGAALYAFGTYVLPFLLKTVWEGAALIWGCAVLGASLLLFAQPQFWRAIKAFNYIIAKTLTGWAIAWDDFAYQEMEIMQAEKDREVIKAQRIVLAGQAAQKEEELERARYSLKEAEACIKTLQKENNPENVDDLQFQAAEMVRQQEFINDITPLYNNILDLGKMLDEVYKQTGFKVKDAMAELKIQKQKLESYTAGQTAMQSAMSVLMGDAGLSKDALQAREAVKAKIALKIGSIKTTLDIIAPVIRDRQLKDRTKVTMALDSMKKLEIEGTPVAMQIPVARPLTNKLLS